MASGTRGATSGQTHQPTGYDETILKEESTPQKIKNYVKGKTMMDWLKRDLGPVAGCTVSCAAAGAAMGAVIPLPGTTIPCLIVGAAYGLFLGFECEVYLNYQEFLNWKSDKQNAEAITAVDQKYANAISSRYIDTITQSVMLRPMRHKTNHQLLMEDQSIKDLVKNNGKNGVVKDANGFGMEIRYEDFEFDPVALMHIQKTTKEILEKDLKELENADPKAIEGLKLRLAGIKKELTKFYLKGQEFYDNQLREGKIDLDQYIEIMRKFGESMTNK